MAQFLRGCQIILCAFLKLSFIYFIKLRAVLCMSSYLVHLLSTAETKNKCKEILVFRRWHLKINNVKLYYLLFLIPFFVNRYTARISSELARKP